MKGILIAVAVVLILGGAGGAYVLLNQEGAPSVPQAVPLSPAAEPSPAPVPSIIPPPSQQVTPPAVTDQANNSFDCGKSTFIVIAGGPSGPYGEEANARAREYFETNGFVLDDESGSRFVVEPSQNTKEYWMEKVQDDGIGSTQYDNVGCDLIE